MATEREKLLSKLLTECYLKVAFLGIEGRGVLAIAAIALLLLLTVQSIALPQWMLTCSIKNAIMMHTDAIAPKTRAMRSNGKCD